MPSFKHLDLSLTRDEAINAIIASIAAEELALSRIIEAESEKIKYVVGCAKSRGCQKEDLVNVLKINESAKDLLERVTDMQIVLKNKLALAARFLPMPCPPHPCPPCPPPKPKPKPKPKPRLCTSVFCPITKYAWRAGKTLPLFESVCCEGGAWLASARGENLILLPNRSRFEIVVDLEIEKQSAESIAIEIEFRQGSEMADVQTLKSDTKNKRARLTRTLFYNTSYDGKENAVAVVLRSPDDLRIVQGSVLATRLP